MSGPDAHSFLLPRMHPSAGACRRAQPPQNEARLGLRVELHYLNGDLSAAEIAYKFSTESAHEHKLVHSGGSFSI